MIWFVALMLCVCDGPSLHAQIINQKSNPYASSADVADGAETFQYQCAGCHGPQGTGGRAPDLTINQLQQGASDAALFETVRFGIPGTEMTGTRFPDKRVWQIVSYLKSLRRQNTRVEARGDVTRGQALFEGKGGCSGCHWVRGKGGRLGPDLTRIGARRSLDGLLVALLAPDEDLDPAYWQWKLVDKDGRVITGIRLNEDNFSIRLLDSNENLVSLDKQELKQIQRQPSSSMPSYRDTLRREELDDLVAYLHSLR